jgi:hypothetical protein
MSSKFTAFLYPTLCSLQPQALEYDLVEFQA